MPFSLPHGTPKPYAGSLVVCAGTVTCRQVSEMGLGFMVFKKLFTNNEWVPQLQQSLDKYHAGNPMDSYMRIAKQDGYIGGIATVPCRPNKGLTVTQYVNAKHQEEDFRFQYYTAIYSALIDARKLNKPLFIQPLGIGAYNWDPKLAAELFAAAIEKLDPNDTQHVTIPIFNTQPGSKDQIFEQTFIAEMAQRGRHPTNNPPLALTADPSDLEDEEEPLLTIANKLIGNIENKEGSRLTSGRDSEKVRLLNDFCNKVKAETRPLEPGNEIHSEYVSELLNICRMRRHYWHFWAEPESVRECMLLLGKNDIPLPGEEPGLKNRDI